MPYDGYHLQHQKRASKQASNTRGLQTREDYQGRQVGALYGGRGERQDYLGLGKAELHWEFHACLSLSQTGAPCKATERTVSCGCQLPGPLGCLPQKVQPGAIWEASDILHMGAAQVGPHTGSPGPAVSLGHPAAPRERERWQQMGPLLTSTGFLSTTESATQPKTPFSRLQTLCADGGMLGRMLESESECSAMGVLSGSGML